MRPVDANGDPIDSPYALVMKDASPVPLVSPATPAAGLVTLVPPFGAICCIFVTADAAFVADTADGANGKYPTDAGSHFRYPCANKKPIFIVTAQPVYFSFEVI